MHCCDEKGGYAIKLPPLDEIKNSAHLGQPRGRPGCKNCRRVHATAPLHATAMRRAGWHHWADWGCGLRALLLLLVLLSTC